MKATNSIITFNCTDVENEFNRLAAKITGVLAAEAVVFMSAFKSRADIINPRYSLSPRASTTDFSTLNKHDRTEIYKNTEGGDEQECDLKRQ